MNLKDVVCKLVLKFEPITTFHCILTQKHSKDGRGEAEVLEIFFFFFNGRVCRTQTSVPAVIPQLFLQKQHSP